MAIHQILLLAFVCLSIPLSTSLQYADDTFHLKTYIIQVHPPNGAEFHTADDREKWHDSILSAAIGVPAAERLIYSYGHAFDGFAARLTADEVKALSDTDWFVDAYQGGRYKHYTTHTPKYLGLHQGQGIWNFTNMGEGTIIGIIDSGISPHHPSFNDDGMPPPPAKWKGRCEFADKHLCNNKLIGARSFLNATLRAMNTSTAVPPTDDEGHGTHVASIAAGQFVNDFVSSLGANSDGPASGIAPRAHLAIYRISMKAMDSLEDVDPSADILAAVDAAVADGVDVINLSGGFMPAQFFDDVVAIAAFRAVAKGVFVSTACGNNGRAPFAISNAAPWLLTVGASTIDRRFTASVKLGNGVELDGEAAYQPQDFGTKMLPVVQLSYCEQEDIDGTDIRGKVVLCPFSTEQPDQIVKAGGGAALVMANPDIFQNSTIAVPMLLPGVIVGYSDGEKMTAYVNSTANPVATVVFKGTVTGLAGSPAVAAFSSRGPSSVSPGILKPDIVGPGMNILGAWPNNVPIGSPAASTGPPLFNTMFGSSFSAPHLSAVAALIKSAHRDWSPAAIKSAIMTTADVLDRDGNRIADETGKAADVFAMGAGHVNPTRAVDPGLVYDITTDDYVAYLCGLGYEDRSVARIAQHPVSCAAIKKIGEQELNYPSISVNFEPETSQSVTLERTVTNVGEAVSTYWFENEAPAGVSVDVEPKRLVFSKLGEKMTYKVTFGTKGGAAGTAVEGRLRLVSGRRVVRSPISVTFGEYIPGGEMPGMGA